MIHDKHSLDEMLKKADKDRKFLVGLSLRGLPDEYLHEIVKDMDDEELQAQEENAYVMAIKVRKHLEENP